MFGANAYGSAYFGQASSGASSQTRGYATVTDHVRDAATAALSNGQGSASIADHVRDAAAVTLL